MRKLVFWMPLLFVGSMVYWTLAVSLGGLSLGAIWPSLELQTTESDIYQPIRVTFGRGPLPGQVMELPPARMSGAVGEVEGGMAGEELVELDADVSEALEVSAVEVDETSAKETRAAAGAATGGDPTPPTAGPPQGPGDTAF